MKAILTMDTYPDDYHASDRLNSLLLDGIDVGLEHLASASGLVPMLIIDTPQGYNLAIIQADDERALRDLTARRLAESPGASAYALLFEVALQFKGTVLEAVAVEGAEVDMPHGYRLIGIAGNETGAVYHGHADQLLQPAEPR
jgi:hypothetical protein